MTGYSVEYRGVRLDRTFDSREELYSWLKETYGDLGNPLEYFWGMAEYKGSTTGEHQLTYIIKPELVMKAVSN